MIPGFFTVWLVCTMFSAGMLLFMAYWGVKNPKCPSGRPEPVTLWDVMIGTTVSLCPIVNILVSVGMVAWFCTEVAPRIVLFGGRQ